MTQKGTHTWDLIVDYHECPNCGYIIESREGYQLEGGQYIKNLECPRCHHKFIVTKGKKNSIFPLFK